MLKNVKKTSFERQTAGCGLGVVKTKQKGLKWIGVGQSGSEWIRVGQSGSEHGLVLPLSGL